MPERRKKSLRSNDEIRRHVLGRDGGSCRWPGCKAGDHLDVLFILETDTSNNQEVPVYSNGITLCPKHIDIVNLHNKAFGPLVYDLIQLVEFENDLQETEKMYKEILK